MVKPFSSSELRARIQAITRRAARSQNEQMCIEDLVLDVNIFQATRGDVHIRLTKKEFALLEYMMRHKGIILSRAMLMEHVWSADSDPFSNTVEAHIRNLRKKINLAGKSDLIANVPGHGYIIDSSDRLMRFQR
jgi:DNA-binding response OmpR family regulator